MSQELIINLADTSLDDVNKVGGKAASLGEMISGLNKKNIKVPQGFVITVESYFRFLDYNHIDVNVEDPREIKSLILDGRIPEDVKNEILNYYGKLRIKKVAVRSSATCEDGEEHSFAGQQDTFLNVNTELRLLRRVKECWASLFNERAISYRQRFGFIASGPSLESSDDEENMSGEDISNGVAIAIVVQEMVSSYISGTAFGLDTETGFGNIILINAIYGFGELLVGGNVIPDEYKIFKPTGKMISRTMGPKNTKLIFDNGENVEIEVEEELRDRFCMTPAEVEKLGKWVTVIEKYYRERYANPNLFIDVEWGMDDKRNLFILQARPETIHSKKSSRDKLYRYHFSEESNDETTRRKTKMFTGIAVGENISEGQVRIITDQMFKENPKKMIAEFPEKAILVSEMISPDWDAFMEKASGIITDKGSRTCHAAIVSREMGLPAIVGVSRSGIEPTKFMRNGQRVTISCAEGEVGYVYRGIVPFEKTSINVGKLEDRLNSLKTNIMLNIGNPNLAFKYARLPHRGVGLARMEFIITEYIGIHPLSCINNDLEPHVRNMVEKKGFNDPKEYFITKLTEGLAKIAATAYPYPAIIRFSDFKTNEYSKLSGGNVYESIEENPMLGWRGASRYYCDEYLKAFEMECEAIRRLVEKLKFTNIVVMIPFCRSVEELEKVTAILQKNGIKRDQIPLYIMAEIPSNFILCEDFCKTIDGFSIGSNDLCQLVLGVDRDNEKVSHIYDERNPAVTKTIQSFIRRVKRENPDIKIGICGQAPSDYSEITQMLVNENIDSISVVPDALEKTINTVYEIENGLFSTEEEETDTKEKENEIKEENGNFNQIDLSNSSNSSSPDSDSTTDDLSDGYTSDGSSNESDDE